MSSQQHQQKHQSLQNKSANPTDISAGSQANRATARINSRSLLDIGFPGYRQEGKLGNMASANPPTLLQPELDASHAPLSSMNLEYGDENPFPFIDRDISWLQFNARVLGEARSQKNPLLERVKFLGISASNLDEFFTIRFASLNRTILSLTKTGHFAKAHYFSQTRLSVLKEVADLVAKQEAILSRIIQDLKLKGIEVVCPCKDASPEVLEIGKALIQQKVLQKLKVRNRFRIRDLRQVGNLQMAVSAFTDLWWLVPRDIPPVLWSQNQDKSKILVFFLDDLLLWYLEEALGFPNKLGIIKLTRDGDVPLNLNEEDTESIPDIIRTGISGRDSGKIVRLQYFGNMTNDFLQQVSNSLGISADQIFSAPRTLALQGLPSVVNQFPEAFRTDPELCYPPIHYIIPTVFNNYSRLLESLNSRDLLFHHPYDSFDAFCSWIKEACQDPFVVSVEMTVYRMDAVSSVIESLKQAARMKRIRIIIELRARFDELNNLKLADELRSAGAQVAFGFGRLKIHAKIALVTRMDQNGYRLYTHLSTGNYNAITARQYTDLAILTADPMIGEDARLFFNSLFQEKIPSSFRRLISAPTQLHRRILQLIDEETKAAQAGKSAQIIAKVNSLVDQTVIKKLYAASQAGVQIDLIVRGACSLIPKVKGLSENIRVISIVDRFLEHSRIYSFESSKMLYLSSADWMPRNFFSRLELAFPILDQRIYKYIKNYLLPIYLSDNVKAHELASDGKWRLRVPARGQPEIRSQFYLEDLTLHGYEGTPLQTV